MTKSQRAAASKSKARSASSSGMGNTANVLVRASRDVAPAKDPRHSVSLAPKLASEGGSGSRQAVLDPAPATVAPADRISGQAERRDAAVGGSLVVARGGGVAEGKEVRVEVGGDSDVEESVGENEGATSGGGEYEGGGSGGGNGGLTVLLGSPRFESYPESDRGESMGVLVKRRQRGAAVSRSMLQSSALRISLHFRCFVALALHQQPPCR